MISVIIYKKAFIGTVLSNLVRVQILKFNSHRFVFLNTFVSLAGRNGYALCCLPFQYESTKKM